MQLSSSRVINLILGILGIIVIGILFLNGLQKEQTIGDILELVGALLISFGFISQGLFKFVPWYSLILFQLGVALYVSPLCLRLRENPSSFLGWLSVLVVITIVYDAIKRIIAHGKTSKNC